MFKKRKMAKQLASVGSHVDTSYMIYVNNEEPVMFPSRDECMSYLKQFRESNEIFKLQIFRIETYSL